ncbi:MAG: hypothetical protein GWM98_09255 [Nitrospinaceae bacterium]|nr:hypothetical protein [Nitrospinaceae bacterium]NIR54645.1 hypothetical protein [Nitrospinaceae bacterium]NIS85062.1 hypothetical protein [Nitrospinaceae bacterium]NIT81879.1 hypothetical protein [Nitrospinaceae bacterium]NIU44143.1 hypothetical protein [Nitrospinaceae bacterium]
MNSKSRQTLLAGLILGTVWIGAGEWGQASHMGRPSIEQKDREIPHYVYPGDYGEEISRAKEKFKNAFGYELMDLDQVWRPDEIERLHGAFAKLPENFYRMPGLKGFYRASELKVEGRQDDPSGIPAATFPRFLTVYRQKFQAYQVVLKDEPLRIEFYNGIFYEGEEDFDNIVHHEMAHIYDLSHGFLTFQSEWLKLAGFRLLHLPALDGKADSDFLYTLISDPAVDHYAPVSNRHLPTYSRQNSQEDFANSVAAYLHYPYFKWTHPNRYLFLKEHVFENKEFFPEQAGPPAYAERLTRDFNDALAGEKWKEIRRLALENTRYLNLSLEKQLVDLLAQAVARKISPEADLSLAIVSCYFYHPQAIQLRRDLWAQQRIQLAKLFRDARCRRMGKGEFEGAQARWPMDQIYFYREKGQAVLQFLDPAGLTATARGFKNRYRWRLSITKPRSRVVARGETAWRAESNGAVKINLKETAKGRFVLPFGRQLIFEIRAEREGPKPGRPLVSPWRPIRIVVQPDFEYLGPENADFHFIYPPSWKQNP